MKKAKLTFIRGSSLGTRNQCPHPGPELGPRNIAGAELVKYPVGTGAPSDEDWDQTSL